MLVNERKWILTFTVAIIGLFQITTGFPLAHATEPVANSSTIITTTTKAPEVLRPVGLTSQSAWDTSDHFPEPVSMAAVGDIAMAGIAGSSSSNEPKDPSIAEKAATTNSNKVAPGSNADQPGKVTNPTPSPGLSAATQLT